MYFKMYINDLLKKNNFIKNFKISIKKINKNKVSLLKIKNNIIESIIKLFIQIFFYSRYLHDLSILFFLYFFPIQSLI